MTTPPKYRPVKTGEPSFYQIYEYRGTTADGEVYINYTPNQIYKTEEAAKKACNALNKAAPYIYVSSYAQARRLAYFSDLERDDWLYIYRQDQLCGIELPHKKTVFIHNDVPEEFVKTRVRK